jgi:hypothetical protein
MKNFWLKREEAKDFGKIISLIKSHIKELDSKKTEIPESVYFATRFILEESVDALESIIVLRKGGHFRSCLMLARSILENSVNLQYIYKADTEARALNFRLFSMKMFLKRLESNQEDFPGKDGLLDTFRTLVKLYKPSGENKNHWDGVTIKKIFDELKLSSLYTNWYSRLSGFTHSQYSDSRDIEQDGPYSDFLYRLVFKDLLVAVLETLKVINGKYNLLEGGAIITDYPHPGAVLAFSINLKADNDFREKNKK